MSTENLFEIAIEKNESNEFFCGKGEYFVRSPDYDGHVHGAHMGGWVESFLKDDIKNSQVFSTVFVSFIENLDITKEDLNHLLANLSAYFALKNTGRLVNADLFSDNNSNEIVPLEKYLKAIFNSPVFDEEKDRLYRHANYMKSNGNDVFLRIIESMAEGSR